jgi:hypothetical protein
MRRILCFACILAAGIAAKAAFLPAPSEIKKGLTIVVSEKGYALLGKDTFEVDQMALELTKRLWKSYTGTGKMYAAIHVQYNGQVNDMDKGLVLKEIQTAQKNALTEVCLQTHKKLFDDLSDRQQRKIQRQFPVLFQTSFQ